MSNFDDIFTTAPQETMGVPKAENADFDRTSWAEQKQMEREQAYSLIDTTAESLTQDSSKFKGYLDVQSKFDRYSVANNLLILAQKPEATRLSDYKTWKENDSAIKKGEKGISILEPGEEYTREDGSIGVSYNVKKVFDISQTNAKQTTPPAVRKDDRLLIKALVSNALVTINISDQMPDNVSAIYKPATKEILIRNGLNGADIFKALSQELAHAEMDKGNYNRSECVFPAYCTSYILCKRNGIDLSSYSFDCLPAEYKNMESKDIRALLSITRDTANDISSKMSKVLEPVKCQNKNKEDQSR
jgi:hypothetical protein